MRAVVLVGLLLASAGADAQPRAELGLAWQAPTSCPDVASVRARIEQRLGRSLDDGGAAGIDITVEHHHHRFVARVDLRAITVANDVRTLTSARCDELADAVAVIVARVARERTLVAAGPVVTGRARVATIAALTPDAPAIERTVVADHVHVGLAPRSWSLGMRLSGVSGIGIVPEVGLGAELAIAVRRHAALAEIAETRWLASGADARFGGPAHVDVGLQVTAVRVGWRPEGMPLRAFAAAEVGTMDGVGVTSQSGRWFAAGAGFGVAWQMNSWLRLVGSTEVMAAIERVRFAMNGVIIYAPSPMSARASCGIEVGWQ